MTHDHTTIRMVLSFFLLGLSWSTVQAADPAGIIILRDVAGYPANAVSFVDIQWVNTNGGYVTDAAGHTTPFVNDGIGKVVYFNQAYYDLIDHNQNWINWRAGIQNREIVLPPFSAISLGPDDLPRLKAQMQQWNDIAQANPSGQGLLAPIVATLNDAITRLSGGYVLRSGKWLTEKEAEAQSTTTAAVDVNKPVTFTTKDGKTYVNATVTVTSTGVTVMTADGGATLSFAQMPDDLSGFPEGAQSEIQARQTRMKAVAATENASSSGGWLDSVTSFVEDIYHKIAAFFATTPTPSASASTNSASTNAPASHP